MVIEILLIVCISVFILLIIMDLILISAFILLIIVDIWDHKSINQIRKTLKEGTIDVEDLEIGSNI